MIQCGNIYVIHVVTVSYKRRLKYSLKLERLDVNTLFCDYISNIRILKYPFINLKANLILQKISEYEVYDFFIKMS